MKKLIFIVLIALSVFSCKSSKQVVAKKITHSKIDKVIYNTNTYKGTKYKFGGTTKKGMDCSGLIYTAFKKENILLPRVSRDMANSGKNIHLNKVKKGDLLFFITGRKNRINHVGLVTKIKNNEIFFIHSSTKRGVIISSLKEPYYKKRFTKVRRIIF